MIVVDTEVTVEDVGDLSRNMRDVEVREILASHGLAPEEMLFESLRQSVESGVATVNGRVMCIWGVTRVSPGVGCAWMLTSNLVERYPKAFMRKCRQVIEGMFDRWDVLVNLIDCRHVQSIRWAEHLGFCLEEPEVVDGFNTDDEFRGFSVRKRDLPWVQQ